MKFVAIGYSSSLSGRSPCGGAWIEIAGGWRLWLAALLSLPVRGSVD